MSNFIFPLDNNSLTSPKQNLSRSSVKLVTQLIENLELRQTLGTPASEEAQALQYLRLALVCLKLSEERNLERYCRLAYVPEGLGAGGY